MTRDDPERADGPPQRLEPNQELFGRADELRHYLEHQELYPVERHLLDRYVRPGLRVLELGCGAGRVAVHLKARGCDVTGFDYNRVIVEEARRRFPDLDIRHGDARRIALGDATADVVLFSFNGIDYVPDAAGRSQCLREAHRVLRDGGLFVFSSHNLKSIPVNVLLDRPRSFYLRNLHHFFRAETRILEREYGGFDTHYSSVGYYRRLLGEHGFETLETVGDRMVKFPRIAAIEKALFAEDYLETWLYYVGRKGK